MVAILLPVIKAENDDIRGSSMYFVRTFSTHQPCVKPLFNHSSTLLVYVIYGYLLMNAVYVIFTTI